MKPAVVATALHVRALVLPDDLERDLWIAGGRFTLEPVEGARSIATGGVAVPGLVDAHAHLQLFSPAVGAADVTERARASAQAHLEAGVLAIREPGGPEGGSPGIGPSDGLPRLRSAGRFLASPGGYVPGLAREVADDALPDAAAEEAAAGGGWVKIIGDFIRPGIGLVPNFSQYALRETVARVHAIGTRVAIHAILPEVIAAAAEAGVDTIEHATLLESDLIPLLAARGCTLVPTMTIDDLVCGFVRQAGAPDAEVDRIERALTGLGEVVRRAAEAGVRVLAGTDAGMVPHGLIAQEIRALMDAGISPHEALGAGSWDARAYLGYPGIEEGAPGDLVVFRQDPRERPATLDEPIAIILDGRPVR